jgi:chromosome segregation ATPase
MKSALVVSMALALLVSAGCKTTRARGGRDPIPTKESAAPEKENPANERARAEKLLSDRRTQRDSVLAELAIVEREQKKRKGDSPSAENDQAIQDLSVRRKTLERDRNALDLEIARLENRVKDLPAGELTQEESEMDALLRMAEGEALKQDELARAREAERRRLAEKRRQLEEVRRMEEAARREAEKAKTPAGTVPPFEERYASTILRIRARLATYKRW